MTSRIPFLSAVLATEGLYCVVGLKKGAPRQTFVETLETLQGPYTYTEILEILSGPEWTELVQEKS